MLTIGLVELDGQTLDYFPSSGDSWKLVRLIARGGRVPARAYADPKLDAVAFLGSNIKKLHFAERALLHGKHVLADFPASGTVESARKFEAIAIGKELHVYSPNLLKNEPGFQELKRVSCNPTSKMLSLTVTCGVSAKFKGHEFQMKLAQLFDVLEWLGNSKITDISVEKSTQRLPAAALVALGSFENGVKTLLNVYSIPASKRSRLWVDVVFKDSFVHVDPYVQSIRIIRFQDKSIEELNWATSALVSLIEDFVSRIYSEREPLDLVNLERMLNLASSVIGG